MGPAQVMVALAFFSAVVLVFLMLTSAYRRRLDFKQRQLELKAQAAPPVVTHPSDAFRELEKRVRVLERIATDRAPDLASQIEALRDVPAPGALQFESEERA